jgi:hypothetical protein
LSSLRLLPRLLCLVLTKQDLENSRGGEYFCHRCACCLIPYGNTGRSNISLMSSRFLYVFAVEYLLPGRTESRIYSLYQPVTGKILPE